VTGGNVVECSGLVRKGFLLNLSKMFSYVVVNWTLAHEIILEELSFIFKKGLVADVFPSTSEAVDIETIVMVLHPNSGQGVVILNFICCQ
jgi:hypothetical protein